MAFIISNNTMKKFPRQMLMSWLMLIFFHKEKEFYLKGIIILIMILKAKLDFKA